jgi:hypothetical protein
MRLDLLLVLLVAAIISKTSAKPIDDEYTEGDEGEEGEVGDLIAPDFVSSSLSVRVPLGKRLKLTCQANNDIKDHSMLWKKPGANGDAGILSINGNVVGKDNRVRLRELDGNEGYELVIDGVEERDEGKYECQISSAPPKSIFFQVEIGGEGEQVVEHLASSGEAEAEDDGGGAAAIRPAWALVGALLVSLAVTFCQL